MSTNARPEKNVGSDGNKNIAANTANIPELSQDEHKEVEQRVSISALVVHETVREEGERELHRTFVALICSAIAAGLSMGFSLVAKGLLYQYLPATFWRPLVDNFGYSLGFLIVVLGRQQLFTENTLTVILPLLAHPNKNTFFCVARLWCIVLLGNLVGAFLFATLIAHTSAFRPDVLHTFATISQQSLSGSFGNLIVRGIFAGWLIALMVWLLPAAESSRFQTIIFLTYIVGVGEFAHIIVDSVSAFYLINLGMMSWQTALGGALLPTLIGNIIGGVSLVAVLNYAQVAGETVRKA